MLAHTLETTQEEGVCPHCEGHSFYNSWGEGNAVCAECGEEFNISAVDGKLVGQPIPDNSFEVTTHV